MPKRWLSGPQVAEFMRNCPDELCDLVLELRDLVRDIAPDVAEEIKFHSLCYFKPDSPYRSIGGNVCAIGWKDDFAVLGFIHGASLPDPRGLLRGKGKAKRHIEIRSAADIDRPAFAALIRASLAFTPRE